MSPVSKCGRENATSVITVVRGHMTKKSSIELLEYESPHKEFETGSW